MRAGAGRVAARRRVLDHHLHTAYAAVRLLNPHRETLDLEAPYPGTAAEGQRGRAGTPKRPALPDGWLASRELGAEASVALTEAELDHSGG